MKKSAAFFITIPKYNEFEFMIQKWYFTDKVRYEKRPKDGGKELKYRRAKLNIKFSNIPIEKDTRILFQKQCKLGGYDVRHEIWSWDGYRGESLIFSNDDVAGLTDRDIKRLVRTSGLIDEGSAMTLNRSTDFTFCNFNFE